MTLLLRLAFTAAATAGAVWLLATGRPLGGLLALPLAAVLVRRWAESGGVARLVARVR